MYAYCVVKNLKCVTIQLSILHYEFICALIGTYQIFKEKIFKAVTQ